MTINNKPKLDISSVRQNKVKLGIFEIYTEQQCGVPGENRFKRKKGSLLDSTRAKHFQGCARYVLWGTYHRPIISQPGVDGLESITEQISCKIAGDSFSQTTLWYTVGSHALLTRCGRTRGQ